MVRQAPDGTIEFRFFRPHARHVTIAGDFNQWNQTCLPMTKGPDGWWRHELELAPGCYQFRYLGDGEWYTDHAAFGVEHGPFGLNAVVMVEPPMEKPPQLRPLPRPTSTRLPHISETEQPSLHDWGDGDDRWTSPAREPLTAVAI